MGAKVQELDIDDPRKDYIVDTYKEMLERIDLLKEADRFWRETLEHPQMEQMLEKYHDEIQEKTLSWLDIKKSEFPDSQSRVAALNNVLKEIEEKPGNARSELANARRAAYSYYNDNILFLQAAGLEPPELPKVEEVAKAPTLCIGLNQDELENLSDDENKEFLDNLEDAGFGLNADEDDKAFAFVENPTDEHKKLAYDLKDHACVTQVWSDGIESEEDDSEGDAE